DGLPGPLSERGQYPLPVLGKREREMPDVTFVQHRSCVDLALIGGRGGEIRPEREEPGRRVHPQSKPACIVDADLVSPVSRTRIEHHLDLDLAAVALEDAKDLVDRKSTRLNSSHRTISYAVFCLKKKKK